MPSFIRWRRLFNNVHPVSRQVLTPINLRLPPLRLLQTPPSGYEKAAAAIANLGEDDVIEEETLPGYDAAEFYPAHTKEVLRDRYQLIAKVGTGGSSTVWLAEDCRATWAWFRNYFVVLKILSTAFSKEGEKNMELDVSCCIAAKKSKHPGIKYLRIVNDTFDIDRSGGRNTVLVYEPMREPLTTFQQRLHDSTFSLDLLKVLIQYLLQGLDFLHTECHVIHTDLKPANILVGVESNAVLNEAAAEEARHPIPFVQRQDRRIYATRNLGPIQSTPGPPKIGDFGLAIFAKDKPYDHSIQPVLFQAPEVILRAGWSYSADIWNLGVMMWDLLQGRPLFTATDENHAYDFSAHLAEMISFLGAPPPDLLKRGQRTARYFDGEGKLIRNNQPPSDRKTLEDTATAIEGLKDKAQFLAFARRMLTWLPEERATAAELLHDEWFNGLGAS